MDQQTRHARPTDMEDICRDLDRAVFDGQNVIAALTAVGEAIDAASSSDDNGRAIRGVALAFEGVFQRIGTLSEQLGALYRQDKAAAS